MKLKVWQCVLLGAALIALGLYLHLGFTHSPSSTYERYGIVYERTSSRSQLWYSLRGWLTVPVGLALLIFGEAWRVYQAAQAETVVTADDAPPAPKKPQRAPLPSPPRLGDDPFREPPRLHIAVVRHETQPAAAPIVPGDPDDKPKLLT